MKKIIQILFATAILNTGVANAQEIGDPIDVKGVKANILTIDDNGNGIAVKKIDGVFCVSPEIVSKLPNNSRYNGKHNTETLIKYISDNDYGLANFPALKTVKEMGGDWYIPGSEELKAAIIESIQIDWEVEDDLDYSQTEGTIKFSSPLAVSNRSVQSSTIADGNAIAHKYYNPTKINKIIGQSKATCYAFCNFSTGKPRVRNPKEQPSETQKAASTSVASNNVTQVSSGNTANVASTNVSSTSPSKTSPTSTTASNPNSTTNSQPATERPVVKKEDKPVQNSIMPITKSEKQNDYQSSSKKEKNDYDSEDNHFWYMRAGWNLMKCKGDDVADIDVQSKSGYQLAWGFEKPMGPLFWGMEFGLGSRGWKIQEGSYEKTLFSHNGFFSPFNLGYKYNFSDDFAVEAHIGIYASGDYYGKVKEINEYSDEWTIYDADGYTYYDVGMQFGFGVWYGKFGCDFLFQKGFVNWQEDMKYQTSNFMIRLGLKL